MSDTATFVGRVDDIAWDGLQLISDTVEIYGNYGFKTVVPVASGRGPIHVIEAAKMGAHCAALLGSHPLTDKGLTALLARLARRSSETIGQAEFPSGLETMGIAAGTVP